jgi:thermostable 8-oxoguanine DNA glycosylase
MSARRRNSVQEIWVGWGEEAKLLTLPHPSDEMMPGVKWGNAASPYSPAYWAARCAWPPEDNPKFETRDGSLIEELGFCLLGGFGIKYEVNVLAFERLRECGVFDLAVRCSESEIEALLLEPLPTKVRPVRYRFPKQRARRLAKMREEMGSRDLSGLTPLDVRDELMEIEGVGPKTASWVVRNLFGSDEVAILDVHIIRVCQFLGIFPARISLPKDYAALEKRFLQFAETAGVSSALLDAIMWAEARTIPSSAWRLT